MKYVLIGKIVNTHGLKGEIRILSEFKYKNKIFKKGMKVYIGKEKIEEEINSYRFHKIFDMITLVGISDIDDVLKYKGEYIFINREDLILDKNEFLDEEIMGLDVYVNDRCLGKLKRIDKHNKNEVLVVKNNEKDYLIPYNFDIIIGVDLNKRRIDVRDIPGLFE